MNTSNIFPPEPFTSIFDQLPAQVYDSAYSRILSISEAFSLSIHCKNVQLQEYSIDYFDRRIHRRLVYPISQIRPNPTLRNCQHDYFQLLIVLEGEIAVCCDSLTYHYHKGDACLINRNIESTEYADDSYSIAFLCFRPDYFSADGPSKTLLTAPDFPKTIAGFFSCNLSSFQQEHDYIECFLRNEKTCLLSEKIAFLRHVMTERSAGLDYHICGILLSLFRILSDPAYYRLRYVNLGKAKEKDMIKAIKRYLDQNPRYVRSDELSKRFHFNAEYLSKIFKKHIGKTLLQYNRTIYLQEAARLLRRTDSSVRSIIETIGLTNMTHFYKLFKEEYHMSPQAYRNSMSASSDKTAEEESL